MIKLLFFVIIGYILFRLLRGVFGSNRELKRTRDGGVIDEMVQDPYCETYIPKRESVKRVIGGEQHFFCSREHADKFEAERKTQKNA